MQSNIIEGSDRTNDGLWRWTVVLIDNNLFINGYIGTGCCNDIVVVLAEKTFDKLIINIKSPGGFIDEVMGIIFFLHQLKAMERIGTIETIAGGECCSSAMFLWLYGNTIGCMEYCTFMMHNPTCRHPEKSCKHKEVNELFLLSHLKIEGDVLRQLMDEQKMLTENDMKQFIPHLQILNL